MEKKQETAGGSSTEGNKNMKSFFLAFNRNLPFLYVSVSMVRSSGNLVQVCNNSYGD
jgi:hypothetical protein